MVSQKCAAITAWTIALAGCAAPPADGGDVDRPAVEAEITEFADAFWEAWSQGDSGLETALSCLDDHPDFAYLAQGRLWRSLPELATTFRSAFAIVQSQAIEIRETAITVLGQDLAYLVQSGTYSITDTNGVTSEDRPFVFSALLARTSNGWRIRYAHESEPGA